MATRPGDTIWELVAQAAETLPEPFSRQQLITWIAKRRTDVEISSISAHIHVATADIPNRHRHQLGARPPLLERIDRGLYRRYRGAGQVQTRPDVPAGTSETLRYQMGAPVAVQVVLVGCSRTKLETAAPAGELFRGAVFQRARDYAVRQDIPWFVLSGKYGLLDPDDVVGPYDLYLAHRSAPYRRAWGEWVVTQLSERLPLRGTTVEAHAGESYCAPLREPLRRLGATLATPLAGLGYGERLAWSGYRSPTMDAREEHRESSSAGRSAPDLERLLDPRSARSPAEFLEAGARGLDAPGLYTWWIDEDGARLLSAGMGHPINAGLLYAGKAGGHRENAAPSTSTLWGRIAGNHLRGNVGSSTFRKSLTALLKAAGQPHSEYDLTAWMHAHLRVAVLAVPSEQVASLEAELVARANPPLNLAGVPNDAARSALSRLRGLMSRQPAPTGSGEAPNSPPPAPDPDPDPAQAFARRLRHDVDAMSRSGYRPTIFLRMLADHGAVETARRLLANPDVSYGFGYLWEHGMLQHSVENAVLDPRFNALFSDVERNAARTRLHEAGFL